MGYQIIKQPNGLFAIWSSVVDDFVWFDCAKHDLIEIFLKEKEEQITKFVEEKVHALEKGEKAYYQFTMSWEEAKKESCSRRKYTQYEE